jgi:predicted XRE-type DNA-binding protein
MAKQKSDLVAWEPQLSAEELAHIEQLRNELEPQIALMRVIRKALNLTQREVAEALGVTQSNVSKIETSGEPTLSVLSRMAEAKGKRLRLTLESHDGKEEASFELGSAA